MHTMYIFILIAQPGWFKFYPTASSITFSKQLGYMEESEYGGVAVAVHKQTVTVQSTSTLQKPSHWADCQLTPPSQTTGTPSSA